LSVNVAGRLIVNDALTYLELCVAGTGIAQLIDVTIEPLLKRAKLVNLFPEMDRRAFSPLCLLSVAAFRSFQTPSISRFPGVVVASGTLMAVASGR